MHGELISFGLAAAALGLLLLARDRAPGGRQTDRGAHWASRRELAVLRETGRAAGTQSSTEAQRSGQSAGRLALGYHGRSLLRAEQRGNHQAGRRVLDQDRSARSDARAPPSHR
jgi:hypothetical protein